MIKVRIGAPGIICAEKAAWKTGLERRGNGIVYRLSEVCNVKLLSSGRLANMMGAFTVRLASVTFPTWLVLC